MSPRRRGRILICEDDDQDFAILQELLQGVPGVQEIHRVDGGEALLSHLRGNEPRPDLLILDLNMPGTDGRAALAELKKDDRLRRMPIVVLTISDEEADVLQSYDDGANSYVVKPKELADYREHLERLVNYWFNLVNLPPAA